MAIEFEQEKNGMSLMSMIFGIIVVGSLFSAAYFLLFQKPELIEVVLPGEFRSVEDIAKISLDPEKVLRSEKFHALRQYGGEIPTPQKGKSNPFLP